MNTRWSHREPDDEPPVGTTHTAADRTRWVKVRQLGERDWRAALVKAIAATRTEGLTPDHIRAMGYRPVGEGER